MVKALGLNAPEEWQENNARIAEREAVEGMVQEHIASYSRDELEAMLVGIPCAPVNTVNEALNDVQSIARKAVVTVEGVEVLASPLRFHQNENNEV